MTSYLWIDLDNTLMKQDTSMTCLKRLKRDLGVLQLLEIIIRHKSGFKVKKISTFSTNYGIMGMADGIRCCILRLISVPRRLSRKKIVQKSLLPSPFWIFLLLPLAQFIEIFGSIFKRGSVIRIYARGSDDEINNARLQL